MSVSRGGSQPGLNTSRSNVVLKRVTHRGRRISARHCCCCCCWPHKRTRGWQNIPYSSNSNPSTWSMQQVRANWHPKCTSRSIVPSKTRTVNYLLLSVRTILLLKRRNTGPTFSFYYDGTELKTACLPFQVSNKRWWGFQQVTSHHVKVYCDDPDALCFDGRPPVEVFALWGNLLEDPISI